MNGLEDTNKENVTNVYNSTVNNMTILTSTIACIDYMRRNKKAMILPIAMTVIVLILLVASFIVFVKASNMYTVSNNAINEQKERLDAIEEELAEMADNNCKNEEAIANVTSRTDSIITEISTIKKRIDSLGNIKPQVKDYKDNANNNEENIEGYTSSEPVAELNKMKIVSGRSAEVVRKATNTLGEEYDNAILLNGRGDAHVTYYLGKKYSTLSCMISCPDEDHITEGTYPLEIFANNDSNQQLYYMDFGRNTATTPIELDVTGVDFITFRVTKNSVLYDAVGIIISNGRLRFSMCIRD